MPTGTVILPDSMDAILPLARRSCPHGCPPPTGFDHLRARSGDPRVLVLRRDREAKSPAANLGAPVQRTAVRLAHRPEYRESLATGGRRFPPPRPAAHSPGDREQGTFQAAARYLHRARAADS